MHLPVLLFLTVLEMFFKTMQFELNSISHVCPECQLYHKLLLQLPATKKPGAFSSITKEYYCDFSKSKHFVFLNTHSSVGSSLNNARHLYSQHVIF